MTNIEVINRTIAVVTELPQQPVLNQFRLIADELLRAEFKGKVVFDLLISKGMNARFVEAYFDGKTIVRSSLRVSSTNDIPNEIVVRQSHFFVKNSNLLGTSILSSQEIQKLLHQTNISTSSART
ncbi:type II toxin-antitoxin system RnlB family antitoxin [Vibrio alginolyticus]